MTVTTAFVEHGQVVVERDVIRHAVAGAEAVVACGQDTHAFRVNSAILPGSIRPEFNVSSRARRNVFLLVFSGGRGYKRRPNGKGP